MTNINVGRDEFAIIVGKKGNTKLLVPKVKNIHPKQYKALMSVCRDLIKSFEISLKDKK